MENRAVLCPNSVTDYSALGIHWHSPDDCVWDAPADSMRWRPIRHRWAPVAEAQRLSQQDCDNLEGFFRQVLLIQDLTISHIMGELRHVSGLCRRDPTHSTAAESLHNAYRNLLGALMKETDDSVALSVR